MTALDALFGRAESAPADAAAIADAATVLSSARRVAVIRDLAARDHAVDLGTLADALAKREYGPDYSSAERKSVYVTVYQNHLDVLAEADVLASADPDAIQPGPAFETYAALVECIDGQIGGDGQ